MTENELPSNLRGLWDKAKKSLQMKNYDYVEQLLTPIVKTCPEFLDARKALRKAQLTTNAGKKNLLGGAKSAKAGLKIKPLIQTDPREAMSQLEDLIAKDPGSKGLNELLYDAAIAAELPEVGLLALDSLKQVNPKDTDVLMKIAKHHESQKNWADMAECANAVSMLDPSNLEAVNLAMKAATNKSMADNELEKGGKRRDEEGSQMDELISKDVATLTPDQRDAVREKLLADYAEDNNNPLVVKKLAAIYEVAEDLPSALSYYEWALHLSPGDPALQSRITAVKDRQRDAEFEQMESELAENPDSPDADQKRARIAELKKERLMQKVEYFQNEVERNPTDPQLRYSLAEYLYATEQATEAIPELQRAKNNPHVRTKALLLLGKCFSQKNMLDLAINQLEEAEKELSAMDGTKKDVVYERALLHERREEKDAYLEALKQIYEVDYGYRDVAKRVEASYG